MSTGIILTGESGGGKTYSLRNLNPKETFYIDADGKGLNWKGWKTQYNSTNKNYLKSRDPQQIEAFIKLVDEKQKQYKVIIIDTINAIMVGKEMDDMTTPQKGKDGFSTWKDIASFAYNIVYNSNSYRDDLVIIMLAHSQVDDDGFIKLLTNGRKTEKTLLHSYVNNVFYAYKTDDLEYKIKTKMTNSIVKSYAGAFDSDELDNDIVPIIKAINEF